MKRVIGSLLILLVGCSDSTSTVFEPKEPDVIRIELDTGLNDEFPLTQDANGYYHLELGDNWQTLHRVSGSIRKDGFGIENFWVEWESNLYWYLGDTLGYVVKRGLTDNLEYVSYDTVYITGFNGMEVPTSNKTSFSNSRGEINNMIAPVQTMVGDTMKLTANWHDGNMDFYIVLE